MISDNKGIDIFDKNAGTNDPDESSSSSPNASLAEQQASESLSKAESLAGGTDSDSAEIDAALERSGCGSLRLLVSIACVISCVGNSISIVCTSLAMPAAECDLFLSSVQLGLVNGAGFVGMLAGSLLIGALSDIASTRRRQFLAAILGIGAFATMLSALAPNFVALMLLRCLVGVSTGGSFPATMSYFAEWQPRRSRGSAVSALSSCWMLGGMLASGGAWLLLPRPLEWRLFVVGSMSFNAWRLYMGLCALPYVFAAVAFGLFVPDSPSCLVKSEKVEQNQSLLKEIASNHWDRNEIRKVGQPAEVKELAAAADSSSQSTCTARVSSLIADLLGRRYRRSVLLLAAINGSLAFSYYGLLLWFPMLFKRAHQFSEDDSNESQMVSVCAAPVPANRSLLADFDQHRWSACEPDILTATKPYIEAFIVNVFNLPGNLASLLLINRIGRRRLLVASLVLMAASTGLIAGVRSHTHALAFSCSFAAVSAVAYNTYNVISVEILPVRLQASALGFCYALCRIFSLLGTVVFGTLVDAGCLAPMSFSAGALAISALFTCALPATRTGLDLPGVSSSPSENAATEKDLQLSASDRV